MEDCLTPVLFPPGISEDPIVSVYRAKGTSTGTERVWVFAEEVSGSLIAQRSW